MINGPNSTIQIRRVCVCVVPVFFRAKVCGSDCYRSSGHSSLDGDVNKRYRDRKDASLLSCESENGRDKPTCRISGHGLCYPGVRGTHTAAKQYSHAAAFAPCVACAGILATYKSNIIYPSEE